MTSASEPHPNVRVRTRVHSIPRSTPVVRSRIRPASLEPMPSTPTVPVIRHRMRRQTMDSAKVSDLQVEWRPIDGVKPYCRFR